MMNNKNMVLGVLSEEDTSEGTVTASVEENSSVNIEEISPEKKDLENVIEEASVDKKD